MSSDTGKSILYFTAPWCKACKNLEPHLRKLKTPILKRDVSIEPEAAEKRSVTTLPTLILLENGQEVKRLTGVSETVIAELYSFEE